MIKPVLAILIPLKGKVEKSVKISRGDHINQHRLTGLIYRNKLRKIITSVWRCFLKEACKQSQVKKVVGWEEIKT